MWTMSSAVCSPASGGVLVATPSMKFRDRVLSLLDEPRRPVQVAAGGAEALPGEAYAFNSVAQLLKDFEADVVALRGGPI